MESDEKTSSRKFGRRGFLITMGFGAAASALLRKLPGKPSTEISQTAGDLVSFPPTSTSTSLPVGNTKVRDGVFVSWMMGVSQCQTDQTLYPLEIPKHLK